jgi:hypothetical protein
VKVGLRKRGTLQTMFILHGCVGAGGAGVRGPGSESLKGLPDGQPYVDFAALCEQAEV